MEQIIADKLVVFTAKVPKKELPLVNFYISEEVKLFIQSIKEGASITDAIQYLRTISPECLCKLIGVHSEIDTESVYDDVAIVMDNLEECCGGEMLLSDLP